MRPGLRVLLMMIALAAVAWLVYSNALHGPFAFDDWHVIAQNPAIRSFSNIPSYFVDTSKFSLLEGNRDYRPLLLISAALSWRAGGGSPVPFHLVSITLHMANVLLVFLVLRLLLGHADAVRGTQPGVGHDWVAMLGALFFCVHPLATESVNYIVQQSVPMTAFFYLLAFSLFLGAYGPTTTSRPRRLRAAGSALSYSLALLCKPIAITLPLNLLIWDALFGGGPVSAGEERPSRWRRYASRLLKHLPYWIVTLIYVQIRSALFEQPVGSVTDAVRPYSVHVLTQTKAMIFYYLKLAIWPVGLNADLAYPVSNSLLEPRVLAALVVMLIVAVALVWLRRRRLLVFWTVWFPVCLLVTTYLAVLGQVVNEHRVYLSLIGICALGALGVWKLWCVFPERLAGLPRGRRAGRVIVASATVVALATLVFGTRARNEVWASELALWEDAASKSDNYRAHMNYGLALEAVGRPEDALREFETAVELGSYAFPHMNLGLAHAKRGNFDQGLWHLRRAVQLWPALPETHHFLGVGLDLAGQLDAAERALGRAIELRPDYIKANDYLARLLERRAKPEQALAAYRVLHASDPTLDWVVEKINALEQGVVDPAAQQVQRAQEARRRGNVQEAIQILGAARRQHAEHPDILFNLAFYQQTAKMRAAAIETYDDLVRIAPRHRQGHFNLAYAYLQGEVEAEWSRAAVLFRKTLEIDPSYDEALFRLASAYWKLGEESVARDYDRRYLECEGHAELRATSQRRLAGDQGN